MTVHVWRMYMYVTAKAQPAESNVEAVSSLPTQCAECAEACSLLYSIPIPILPSDRYPLCVTATS